ncbi:alpha-L RNA-binding motif-containing protein, partial [Rhizodiscina lignyota]
KVRQDWSKWTLYNLSRLTVPRTDRASYFQQKWAAKSITRGYHGEHIREKKWNRIFSRSIPAVVPMDYRDLAKSDGADQAMGRGQGEDVNTDAVTRLPSKQRTPYMQMAFHPLERRLDTAIWRALFASSVRQARMLCTQGHVRVNGKEMRHPSYNLNPGDMFSVTPKWVMQATGATKFYLGTQERTKKIYEKAQELLKDIRTEFSKATQAEEASADQAAAEAEADAEEEAAASEDGLSEEERAAKKTLKDLRKEIMAVLDEKKPDLSNKQKQLLRALRTDIPKMMSKKQFSAEDVAAAQQRFTEANSANLSDTATSATGASDDLSTPEFTETQIASSTSLLTDLRSQIQYLGQPWRPRPYMSAFAFIPRYLEVNQNVCSAVYLRHAVVRPGLAEVPTPFPEGLNQLAFNWYLKRR